METRFSHLCQRDSSVSMLRVKMARRRSQSQKENRDQNVNRLRRLDQVPELEESVSLDQSVIKRPTRASEGTAPGQKQAKNDHSSAVEERKKMLARYKEAKELQKEKERRAKEKKGGVFKVGLYKPQPLTLLPQVSSAPGRAKTSAPAPSLRVTRSMTQPQQVQKRGASSAPKKVLPQVEPTVVRVTRGRAVSKPQTASGQGKAAPVKGAAGTQTRVRKSAEVKEMDKSLADACPQGEQEVDAKVQEVDAKVQEVDAKVQEVEAKEQEAMPEEQEAMVEEQEVDAKEQEVEAEALPVLPSFAPQGFLFQAPTGLKGFQSAPLTPRSVDAFLIPSVPPAISVPPVEPPCPSPPPQAPLSLTGPQEPQHNVLYFRSVLVSETDRLRELCEQWAGRTEDISVPEDTRDKVRTTVGQARLLMKERFGQFQGLVDDCDLGRGEKLTTCTDLQGFWDMVFFQVEDVIRKFDALKKAESRGWQEEHKPPPPRPKKAVKKPPLAEAAGKAGPRAEVSAAARSRLAAVKAAMRARREAEAVQAPTETGSDPERPVHADAQTVLFQGGFFRVESPARVPGALRRSFRTSAASPCPGSNSTTPARRRTPVHPSPLPQLSRTPRRQPNAGPVSTPRPLPQDQSSPPKPTPPAGREASPSPPSELARRDQSECDSRLQSSAHAGDQSGQTGTHSPAPEAANGQSQTTREHRAETVSQSKLVPDATEPSASQSRGVTESSADDSVPASPPRTPTALTPGQKAEPLPAEGPGLALSPFLSEGGPWSPGDVLQASPSAPLRSHTPPACSMDSPTVPSDAHMAETPDTSYVENVPGLDFERCLQAEVVAVGATATPTSTDVQMDSPGPPQELGGGDDSLVHAAPVQAQTTVQLAALGHTLGPQTEKLEESEPLLFTPELRDRVRQSGCERDFMVFTPTCGQ